MCFPVAARPENGAASCTQLAVPGALTRAGKQRAGADLRFGSHTRAYTSAAQLAAPLKLEEKRNVNKRYSLT